MIHILIFRLAFLALMLIELFAYGVVAALVSEYHPSVELGILFLAGVPFFGAGNYVVYQKLTRARFVELEAKRWLARRRQRNTSGKFFQHQILWLPCVCVVLICMFLGEILGIGSHILHPRSNSVIGFRLSIPITWIVGRSQLNQTAGWSMAGAARIRGMLQAGIAAYQRKQTPLSIGGMTCYGTPGEQQMHDPFPSDYYTLISTQDVSFEGGHLECRSYSAKYKSELNDRNIGCSTPKADFSCLFYGDERSAGEFLKMMHSVKPIK